MKHLIPILCLGLCACAPLVPSADSRAAMNLDSVLNALPTKVSPDGLCYKLVKVEGRTFVATQGPYGVWQLAGPID